MDFVLQPFRYAPHNDFKRRAMTLMQMTDVDWLAPAVTAVALAVAIGVFLSHFEVSVNPR